MKQAVRPKSRKHPLQRFFLSGLVITVPLVVTVYILVFLFRALDNLLHPLLERAVPIWFPGLGILATLLLVFLIGMVTHNFIARKLIGLGEGIVSRIPLAGAIYSAVKQIVSGVADSQPDSPKRAVLVPYPAEPFFALGLLNGETTLADGRRFGLVLMLSSLNPTTGILTLAPWDVIRQVDVPLEEVMPLIISGGMVSPRHLPSHLLP